MLLRETSTRLMDDFFCVFVQSRCRRCAGCLDQSAAEAANFVLFVFCSPRIRSHILYDWDDMLYESKYRFSEFDLNRNYESLSNYYWFVPENVVVHVHYSNTWIK
jgi:hypothetical protein